MVEYKKQFYAYRIATKITDYIKQSKIEVDSMQDPDKPLDIHNFFFDYRKLKVKLTVCKKVSVVTLLDVDELWRSLALVLDLPCSTAVLHSIIIGSIEITWLILPQVAEKIISEAKALDSGPVYPDSRLEHFFRDNDIHELVINDVLYNKENPSLVSLCTDNNSSAKHVSMSTMLPSLELCLCMGLECSFHTKA